MWLTDRQLRSIGFAELGSDVSIDSSALFFGAEYMRLGSHLRIDAFSVLSAGPGELTIGDHVHVGVSVKVYASAGVTLEPFVGLSAGVCVYSASDDYSGGALTNPTVPDDLRDVTAKPDAVGRHVVVGAGTVLLPGVRLGAGASIGALTLVHRDVPELAIFIGNPMRQIGTRDGERLRANEAELLRREQA
jgi:acetyltransferase-like isoleucine patch superfamily enzyme